MSSVTKFVPTHGQSGGRSLSEILLDEQHMAVERKRLAMEPNDNLIRAELAFASAEEREGATLLRSVLNSAHAVVWDAEVTILRVIVSNTVFQQLEMWGADNIDFEPGYDVEG